MTAANSGGSTRFSLSIAVNDVAPSVSYGSAKLALAMGVPVQTLTPSNSGGNVVTWSIDQSLPQGLVFNNTDGSISGTPSAIAAPVVYVITAENSGGRSSVSLTIAVESSVLLELGHADGIGTLRVAGSRALSQDGSGHWVLWNVATSSMLASGDSPCRYARECYGYGGPLRVDLAGPLLVIETPNGLETRAATDGHVLSAINATVSWWKVSADGSYVCAGSKAELVAWSASGQMLVSRPGDYSTAISFAAPGEIRVALGPAGLNVVETISVVTAISTVGPPFLGQFNSWFVDGERFLTNVATTVWTYSKTGIQQDITTVSTTLNLTGQGNWFWTFDSNTPGYPLNIYAVGASASPTTSYSLDVLTIAIPSGLTIGVLAYGTGLVSIIDLSGASPLRVDHAVPISYLDAYGALSNSQWLVGNRHGVLLDGSSPPSAPHYLSLGSAWSIAGSDTRVAVATASGQIFYFDPSTRALEGSINAFSAKVALSSDGAVLAASGDWNDAQYHSDVPPIIFSLPSGTETYAWPSMAPPCPNCSTPVLVGMSLSTSGSVIGQVLWSDDATGTPYHVRQVNAATGGPLIWSETIAGSPDFQPIRLSPDGTLIAVSDGGPDYAASTKIYQNGTLVTAVPGWAVGWIDNGRLLVDSYLSSGPYTGVSMYSSSGLSLGLTIGATALPEVLLGEIQPVAGDSIYVPSFNLIFSLTTGSRTWMSGNPARGIGAVAGSRVVFLSGPRVLTESY